MNILYLTETIEVGGPVTFTKNFLKELQALTHHVTLISFPQEINTFYTIPYKVYLLYKTLAFNKRSKQLTQVEAVFIDQLFTLISYLIVRNFISSLKKTKVVYFFHGSYSLEDKYSKKYYHRPNSKIKNVLKQYLESVFLNQAHLVITFSKYAQELLSDSLKINTKIRSIYPGKDPTLIKISKRYSQEQAKEKLGFAQTKRILLIVSRLEPRKGVLSFLKEIKKNEMALKNYLVVIASPFAHNYHDSYTFFKVLNSLDSQVKIVLINNPNAETKALLYKAAALCILPSLDLETFGFVTLEAMSVGLPIVGYDIGANKELIEKKWLVPLSKNPHILKKIQAVLTISHPERTALSNSLIKKAGHFSWRRFTSEVFVQLNSL